MVFYYFCLEGLADSYIIFEFPKSTSNVQSVTVYISLMENTLYILRKSVSNWQHILYEKNKQTKVMKEYFHCVGR